MSICLSNIKVRRWYCLAEQCTIAATARYPCCCLLMQYQGGLVGWLVGQSSNFDQTDGHIEIKTWCRGSHIIVRQLHLLVFTPRVRARTAEMCVILVLFYWCWNMEIVMTFKWLLEARGAWNCIFNSFLNFWKLGYLVLDAPGSLNNKGTFFCNLTWDSDLIIFRLFTCYTMELY